VYGPLPRLGALARVESVVSTPGLARWPADKPLIVSTSEHSSNAHTRFHIAFDLLCRGTDLATEDFERLVTQGIEDGMCLDGDAMCVFFGALRGRGAPLAPIAELFGDDATRTTTKEER
jgi:hypothetical protein